MYDDLKKENSRAVKISVNVSNFTSHHHKTLSLLYMDADMQESRLTKEIQKLRDRFGLDIVKNGSEL